METIPNATKFYMAAKWYNGLKEHIEKNPTYASLKFLFPTKCDDTKDIGAVFQQHKAAVDRIFCNLSHTAEKMLIEAIDEYNKQVFQVSDKILCAGKFIETRAEQLNQLGHTALPKISENKVQNMLDYFNSTKCYDGPYDQNRPNPDLFSLNELRDRKENTARYKTSDVIKCPHIMEIATDTAIISIVHQHLGTMPIILDYSCWWSFAQAQQEGQHAQLYHFDLADYRFCLMNIYLTDVNMEGGPHTIFENSHEFDDIRKIRENYSGDADQWNSWYFDKFRKTDDEMEQYFNGLKPVSFTGGKGSTLLVNTRGIHKGMVPTGSDRLII